MSLLRRLLGAPAARPAPAPMGPPPAESPLLERLRARAAGPAPSLPEPRVMQTAGGFGMVGRARGGDAQALRRRRMEAEVSRLPPPPAQPRKTLEQQIAEAKETARLAGLASGVAVADTPEFRRVRDLPRRPFPPEHPDQTERYRRPGGTMQLKPLQSAALVEAAQCGGAFVPLGVGQGKTLVSLLLPAAMRAKRAVLLIPSNMRGELERQTTLYRKHFVLPEQLAVVTYHQLSSQADQDILDRLRPDLIIADEAHKVFKSSGRTRRYKRYLTAHPECREVLMTGTPSRRGPGDYGAAVSRALGKGSPLPSHYNELMDWHAAVGAEQKVNPGALLRLCAPGESARTGFARRVRETPGVISNKRDSVEVDLVMRVVEPELPDVVREMIERVRENWEIDGDVHEDPTRHAADLRQLACGFFYKWDWPGGVKDDEWLQARSAWHRAIGHRLKLALRGQDTPGLCERAARAGKWYCPDWEPWALVRDRKAPPRIAVWLSSFLVDHAAELARREDGTIIWYDAIALGEALKQRGIPVYGAGTDAGEATAPVIACSAGSQSEGKNLQHRYWRNLILQCPTDAKKMQQLVGRTHRFGQERPRVEILRYSQTDEMEEAFNKLCTLARYKEEAEWEPQKILFARRE